jgi:phospholipid/cholesterol/gamma-HCH transport system substrate-binding protein
MSFSRNTTRIVALISIAIVSAATAAAITAWQWTAHQKTTIVAYFANSNGIYVGDTVRILGVSVGSIVKIEPRPDAAKITFSFDSRYPVPADARAAILSPSLVAARALQLVPAYTGGPKLADRAVIPLNHTAVPVEWDDFRAQLEKLTDSLQPSVPGGPNSLGELVDTAAANMRGEGATARDTLIKLSQAISALGDHSSDIFSTVRNVQLLVSGLRSSSDLMADFNTNLASLSSALSNTPDEVANAARGLDGTLGDLRSFVADNRESLGTTLDRLGSISTVLNESRGELEQILHEGPTAFVDYTNMYQPAQGALTGTLAVGNFANPVQFICGAIQAASRIGFEESSKLCVQYLAPIIKNRQYNFPPIGINPFVSTAARPNEITYSEDRLRPDAPVPAPPPPDQPLASKAEPPSAPLDDSLPPDAKPTDPGLGLQGMMVPGGKP